jgi:DNA-directed RNA polymerase subunit K/omega
MPRSKFIKPDTNTSSKTTKDKVGSGHDGKSVQNKSNKKKVARVKSGTGKGNTDSESENDFDSNSNGGEKYKNNYDATAKNIGDGDEDDILADGDLQDQDWDDDEVEEDDETAGDETAGDEVAEAEEEIGDTGGDDEDCPYNGGKRGRGIKKISANIDRDDDDDDEGADANVDENELNPELYVKPEHRRSDKNMTKYERVRLLGDRTAQLAQGAKPMIKGVEGMDPKVVAQLELESKMIPIQVIRPMPDGKKERWFVKELILKKKYIIYNFTGGEVDKDLVERIDNEYKKGGSIIGYSHLTNTINKEKDNSVDKILEKTEKTEKIDKKTKKSEKIEDDKKKKVVKKQTTKL